MLRMDNYEEEFSDSKPEDTFVPRKMSIWFKIMVSLGGLLFVGVLFFGFSVMPMAK